MDEGPSAPKPERRRAVVDAPTHRESPLEKTASKVVPDDLRHRIAIYLIEREAIALRRQRWREVAARRTATAEIDSAVQESAGAAEAREPDEPGPISKYARPPVESPDGMVQSGLRKLGDWVRFMLRGEEERR